MLKPTQTHTQKPLQVNPLEISSIAYAFASDNDEVHLVAGEFGHAEELGVRSAICLQVRKLSAPTNLTVQIPTVAAPHACCWVDPILTTVESEKGIS